MQLKLKPRPDWPVLIRSWLWLEYWNETKIESKSKPFPFFSRSWQNETLKLPCNNISVSVHCIIIGCSNHCNHENMPLGILKPKTNSHYCFQFLTVLLLRLLLHQEDPVQPGGKVESESVTYNKTTTTTGIAFYSAKFKQIPAAATSSRYSA